MIRYPFLLLGCSFLFANAQLRGTNTRRLETAVPVELVVALFYVDERLEHSFVQAMMDAHNDVSAAVQHFCKSVNQQVRIVYRLTD